MADGGGGATGTSSSSGAPLDGAFLLQLLRNPPQSQQQLPPPPQSYETLNHHHHRRDPAVAAVGPTYPFSPHTFFRPPTHHHHQQHQETPPHFSPPPSSVPPGFSSRDHHHQHRGPPPGSSGSSLPVPRGGDFPANPPRDRARARGRVASDSDLGESLSYAYRQQQKPPNSMRIEQHVPNHYHVEPPGNHQNMVVQRPGMTMAAEQGMMPTRGVRNHRAPPTEWVPLQRNADRMGDGFNKREREQVNGQSSSLQRELLGGRYGDGADAAQRASQIHQHQNKQSHQSGGGGTGSSYSSAQDSDRDRIFELQGDFGSTRSGLQDSDGFCSQLEETLTLSEDATESSVERHSKSSSKDVRLDLFRGRYVSSQRVRIRRRELGCRYDIDSLTPLFLAIYKSLIPADEEKGKQKQLLLSLGKLVNKEWPNAQLHLYGSCANSFGVSNSDVDICLAIDESNMSKSEILLKLAEILESDNLQNVQALTHARVPIVKMMDPVTGISCDICINNLLAVANTKLLRDYAHIDDRLRQLAFIVKHWAKSRGVNETYRGTLSSYAYVIMCIHFLQQRKPAILPCLQEMEATFVVNVDGIQCAYFDHVDRLRNFGAQNNESIARLLWGFFRYWAYYHDYMNDVISVRAGRNISKREKDWTRRIGNDRHLICIEDPFETSHDLGRVVDKYSIKILREEFERAADVLQYDPNPSVTLFEPYVPRSLPNGLQSD